MISIVSSFGCEREISTKIAFEMSRSRREERREKRRGGKQKENPLGDHKRVREKRKNKRECLGLKESEKKEGGGPDR